jgi:hypothetical protein
MFQNAKILTVAAATLALTVGGLTSAFAETTTSPNATAGTETNATQPDPSKPGAKTSDRTPGDPAPQRTPNATDEGAAGTDAGQTRKVRPIALRVSKRLHP